MITVIFTFLYKRLTRNPDAVTGKYVATMQINGDQKNNLQLLSEALKNAGFKKVGLDETENCLFAQTKFSMNSFSEYIEVQFTQDKCSTNLQFKSICALSPQIFDWGKKKRNYKRFEKQVYKLMPTAALQ